jgi:tetratricopeptide (TPR) repeat protein
MGKTDDAEVMLERALKLDPQMAGAAYNLAVLVGKRDPGRAAELCEKVATSHPEEPKYAYSAAYYQLELGRQNEAIRTLEALLKLHPAYGDAVFMLGDLYAKQGRAEEAQALYNRSLARNDLPSAYRERLSLRLKVLRKSGGN